MDALAEDSERHWLEASLANGQFGRADVMTIGALTASDSIPLGTDLDPAVYRNLWAANKVSDLRCQTLIQWNLGYRVIDAENVGFSYGKEVQNKEKKYAQEGVSKAVSYFKERGIHVIVVTKRAALKAELESDGVDVVIAERTDDVLVLKQAYQYNCPVVSRDGYRAWMEDRRLDPELRQWMQASSDLQVRFSWGAGGSFAPDFDLPKPVLRPAHVEASKSCRLCKKLATDTVAVLKGERHYDLCQECYADWDKE